MTDTFILRITRPDKDSLVAHLLHSKLADDATEVDLNTAKQVRVKAPANRAGRRQLFKNLFWAVQAALE